MSDTSITAHQKALGISQLEAAGVTSQMFQDVFLAGLLSALGVAVASGGNTKDDIAALLSGNATVKYIRRFVARVPFEPSLIGRGFAWWLGSKDGQGLEGEELDCDKRSLALNEVDLCLVLRELCLKGNESSITGENKLCRLIESGVIRLDPAFGWALLQEEGQKILRWLYGTFGTTYLDFFGRVLRNPVVGCRCVLSLNRYNSGSWVCGVRRFDGDWKRDHPSAALLVSSAQAWES